MQTRALFSSFYQRLIVSCQAAVGDDFREPRTLAKFAKAAVAAGAAGIRANGPDDVRAIRECVSVPIIGIQKSVHEDGRILITSEFEAAEALCRAGADIIAIDCTSRGRQTGALERLRRIRDELGVAVMADVATLQEGLEAAAHGADLVASTLRGYTDDTCQVTEFDPLFISELAKRVGVPVLAEGRIREPRQAAAALSAGAWAVIVGTAITRPRDIARRFVLALETEVRNCETRYFLGIDCGGSNIKFGIVSSRGELLFQGMAPTPTGGREPLLGGLKRIGLECLKKAELLGVRVSAAGIATAGWVDNETGVVVYATENLPGWTGTRLADEMREVLALPVAVENDANALAIGEHWFGAGKKVADFVCLTLGTGIGGGCYIGGKLNRGAHYFANSLGHIPVEPEGANCTCGLRGCVEAYANANALIRYAGSGFSTAEDVIRSANVGNLKALAAIRKLAHYLATALLGIVQTLDPKLIILAGGLTQENPILLTELERELRNRVTAWSNRDLRLIVSTLGYHAGVFGAAATALEVHANSAPREYSPSELQEA